MHRSMPCAHLTCCTFGMTFHLPLVLCVMLSCALRTMCSRTAQSRWKMVATPGDEHALLDLISAANKHKVVNSAVENKKLFEAGACFVRAGETKKPPAKPPNRGQLG